MPSALYWASLGRMRLRAWDVSTTGIRAVAQRADHRVEQRRRHQFVGRARNSPVPATRAPRSARPDRLRAPPRGGVIPARSVSPSRGRHSSGQGPACWGHLGTADGQRTAPRPLASTHQEPAPREVGLSVPSFRRTCTAHLMSYCQVKNRSPEASNSSRRDPQTCRQTSTTEPDPPSSWSASTTSRGRSFFVNMSREDATLT